MGLALSIPFLGSLTGLAGTLATSCITGFAFFCTSQAAAGFFRPCDCKSSIATRVGFSLIFLLNSILSWLMLTPWAVHKLESWSYNYIKMSCTDDKCYGYLAVHRLSFALGLFHIIHSLLLIGVRDTRSNRAAIQNGWWGPKLLIYLLLAFLSFSIPNSFFTHLWRYLSLIGSTIFIVIGLVLLVDFAYTWSETCLVKWEETGSPIWQTTLIVSTLVLYAFFFTVTIIDYIYFAPIGAGCGLNAFLISMNLILALIVTGLSITPAIQDASPKAGLAQAAMVSAYCTYLITSAIANYAEGGGNGQCNPIASRAEGAAASMVVAGAVFTFLAIAYSTSRAATQSKALVGKRKAGIALEDEDDGSGDAHALEDGELDVVNRQPGRKETPQIQAIRAAIEAGSLPESALKDFIDDDDEDDVGAPGAKDKDDERRGTRYNYSWFHVIFVLAAMYVAMLLTDWNYVVATDHHVPASTSTFGPTGDLYGLGDESDGRPVRIGRSGVAMWMRVVSSWACLLLYGWTLVAPVLLPDRFEGI